MAQAITPVAIPLNKTTVVTPYPVRNEATGSGVSWAAVSAGAFVTAALGLGLLALGTGAGLSSLSPWSNEGLSPAAVKMGAILWFCLIEILACGLGGYVAGRLRTKWADLHTDEVYFRDTAHGFLVWAVAFVITAALLGSAATSMVGRERSSAQPSESAAVAPNRYYIDSLFRSAQPAGVPDESLRSEIGLIFAHSLRQRELAPEDRTYIAATVAAKTGLNQAAAESRVADVFERDQQAADAARKSVAHSLYWLFVGLLLGAFAASLAATYGGRQRDRVLV
jgi:hypothetical protein